MPSKHPERFSTLLIGAATPDQYVNHSYRLQQGDGQVGLEFMSNIIIKPTEIDRTVAFHLNSMFPLANLIDRVEREGSTIH